MKQGRSNNYAKYLIPDHFRPQLSFAHPPYVQKLKGASLCIKIDDNQRGPNMSPDTTSGNFFSKLKLDEADEGGLQQSENKQKGKRLITDSVKILY